MNDAQFLSILNTITRENRLKLPVLSPEKIPSSKELAVWANCLELCLKRGVSLSDPRWERVIVKTGTECTVFSLEKETSPSPDGDFRVGLQLLIGILGQQEEKEK